MGALRRGLVEAGLARCESLAEHGSTACFVKHRAELPNASAGEHRIAVSTVEGLLRDETALGKECSLQGCNRAWQRELDHDDKRDGEEGSNRLTSLGRSHSRTSPAAVSARIGVREAADITPTARTPVGIHQRRPQPKARASPNGRIIASTTPSSIGWGGGSDGTNESETLSFDSSVELEEGENLPYMVEDVELGSLLDDRRHQPPLWCRPPGTWPGSQSRACSGQPRGRSNEGERN